MSGVLRICTAGSVDDGKSTLIGRLLLDSRAVYEDQLAAATQASARRGVGELDLSFFTDGLRAEREQGITIDVAYRYFATRARKFILADTPGHEQYTRNMATGASTADVAILVVDAHRGPAEQTLRHARIARALGVADVVVAVNKMDLVEYQQGRFAAVEAACRGALEGSRVRVIPVSALHGDNVIEPSQRMPWYDGPPLLACLESLVPESPERESPFRLPVQLVLRAGGTRAYGGRIAAGRIAVGDEIRAWPAGHAARVRALHLGDQEVAEASWPSSVSITLDRELDISRGDVLAIGTPWIGATFEADLVWMDERPLVPGRRYRLKIGPQTATATVDRSLVLNRIERVVVSTTRPIVCDPYHRSRRIGAFVLIDPDSQFTAGAGMIRSPVSDGTPLPSWRAGADRIARKVRAAASHQGAVEALVRELEELLS